MKVTCPICNNTFKSLNSHVYFKHKIHPIDFKLKYPNVILVPDDVKRKTSVSCKQSNCGRWMKDYKFSENRKKEYSKKFSGEKNPFFGKRHSKKTKQKMSDNHADFTGKQNPLVKWLDRDPANREKYAKTMKTAWSSTERKQLLSIRNRKNVISAIQNGNHHPYSNCDHGWFASKKFGRKFYFQSSYEKKFLLFCETSPMISNLCRSSITIPYADDLGVWRIYNPDFLVNEKILTEIKPSGMIHQNSNLRKLSAGIDYSVKNGLQFRVVTEKELENLGNFSWNG